MQALAVDFAKMDDFTLLVLDIGTSSTRALLFDGRAQLLTDSIVQIPNAPRVTPAGDVTFDADALFAAYARPGSPGCAAGVMREGALVFAKGYGSANLDYDIPITPRTVFDIGSVSKQFTVAGIFLLAREGRLSLDVHFVDPEDPEPEIRIARVLEHLVPPGLEPGDRIRVHYAMGVVTEITRDEVARQKSG